MRRDAARECEAGASAQCPDRDHDRRRVMMGVLAFFNMLNVAFGVVIMTTTKRPLFSLAMLAIAQALYASSFLLAKLRRLAGAGLLVGFGLSALLILSIPPNPTQRLHLFGLVLPLVVGSFSTSCRTIPALLLGQCAGLAIVEHLYPSEIWMAHYDPRFIPLLLIALSVTAAGFWLNKRLNDAYARRIDAANDALERARLDAEAASGAKSDFVAAISHEFRTPLSAIVGYAEMMSEDVDAGDPLAEDIRAIEGAAAHLSSLINQVLDLAKIEANRMPLHLAEHSAGAIVEEIAATAAPLVRGVGNRLVWSVTPGLALRTDAVKLRQIALNLVSNSSKFTTTGTIELALERVSKSDAALRVRDTGAGMSEEQLARVFDAFVQAEETTSLTHGGTGLGLALCERLAGLLGGSIEVESEVGVGTLFVVHLPDSVISADLALAFDGATREEPTHKEPRSLLTTLHEFSSEIFA